MQPVTFLIAGLVVVSLGVLVAILGLRMGAVNEEGRRLAHYVAAGARPAEAHPDPLAFRRAELQGSLRQRLLLPWFRGLGAILGRMTPTRSMDRLRKQLVVAGNPLGLGPREFYGIQLLFIIFSFWSAFVLLRGRPAENSDELIVQEAVALAQQPAPQPLTLSRVLMAAFALYSGTQFPKLWLRRRIRARQNKVRRSLPDALDMLSVCADAGLGFDQALQRVSERWRTALGAEFARVTTEMSMGVSRQEALRNLSDRLDVTELTSFTAVMIQSDQMGMSITNTLRSQAEQMRIERRHRAQEEARKAPLKMLFPLLFLILPAMGAVVVGPVIPPIVSVFDQLSSR